MSGGYRTVVADPPWEHASGGPRTIGAGKWSEGSIGARQGVPYETLSVAEISALPVEDMAADDAHLYLWTTNRFLPEAFGVMESWGFGFSTVLTWCKNPMGLGPGGAYAITTEFVLYGRRGRLQPLRRHPTTWFNLKRPHRGRSSKTGEGGPIHSAKPEGIQDLIEQVSPGPYLELFARRERLGWDTWGDQSANSSGLQLAAAFPPPDDQPKERS